VLAGAGLPSQSPEPEIRFVSVEWVCAGQWGVDECGRGHPVRAAYGGQVATPASAAPAGQLVDDPRPRRPARIATGQVRTWSSRRWNRRRGNPLAGHWRGWLRPGAVVVDDRADAGGVRTRSPTAPTASSAPMIRCSWRRSKPWEGPYLNPPESAVILSWTRSHRSRRWPSHGQRS
jgi:hypothetical protein